MGILLNVEVSGGSQLEATVSEMVALANRLGLMVQAKFNDVSLLALPGDEPADIARAYDHEFRSKSAVKIATARGGRLLAG